MVRGKIGSTLMFGVVLLMAALASTLGARGLSQVQAANGDNLASFDAVVTAGIPACGVGTGVAFDGTNLILSCWGSNVLQRVNSATHLNGGAVTIAGLPFGDDLRAMAWDTGRNKLWACNGTSDIVLIDVGAASYAGVTFPAPNTGIGGCIDGLAYDGSDDTLWSSGDVSGTINHLTTAGVPIGIPFPLAGLIGSCGNSGIAVGGAKLYLANNGCSQIWAADKLLTASTLFATFPARLEDLECDNLTFAGAGKGAIWSIDAYDRTLNAWEIPLGECSFGGGVKDTKAPSCALTAVIAGPPKQLKITAQDADSGLAAINVLTATNVVVSVPAFVVGTTSPVVVTATKINPALSSTVKLEVKDVAGNVTICDPVITLVVRETGKPVSETLTGLPQAESKVKVTNGNPGVTNIAITVNGKKFQVAGLKDDEVRDLDVSSAMVPGTDNTITLEARGKPGGSASIVISD